ncbi:MAG: UDP-N-acetylmuramoyl-tripeptide--D-alanyl-D-alanine ligase [Frankiaceae bacterium]|nr:UDP-N-acetylmuramoyl-tripeptide--D-alanyl-D-alanine ligase [Frankiaceae bacterium]
MIRMSLADVAGAVGASRSPEGVLTGEVRIDSRQVRSGDLFVALRGEHGDGHDFAAAAVDAGAAAVLVDRPTTARDIVVPDVLEALQSLARQVFSVDQPLTFGITGSSGKTSTKDLFAQVLSAFGPTLAPVGSFNNEIGLPVTATQRTSDTAYAALEYSARGVGHIAFLCEIVRPHVGVVLNVGSAHLGEFGSVSNIALAKGELVAAATSLVVLNADDPLVAAMSSRTSHRVSWFGTAPNADYRAAVISVGDDGRASFVLETPHGSAPVRLQVRGEHQVSNALAVAAAVLGEGVTTDVAQVAELLTAAGPVSRWRMEVTERTDGVTVVNDAYNANPDSMLAALRTLAVMGGGSRRTWAVLGPMAELGPDGDEAHREVGRCAARLAVSRLVVIGSGAAGIHAGAVSQGLPAEAAARVDDIDGAAALLRAELEPGDVVLVKASRSVGLERLADAILSGADS